MRAVHCERITLCDSEDAGEKEDEDLKVRSMLARSRAAVVTVDNSMRELQMLPVNAGIDREGKSVCMPP